MAMKNHLLMNLRLPAGIEINAFFSTGIEAQPS